MLNNDKLERLVSELISKGKDIPIRNYDGYRYGDTGAMKGFRAASLSFIHRYFGPSHPYYSEFSEATTGESDDNVNAGIQILFAIRADIIEGYLTSVKSLLSAEIFSDFLDMAEHLLENDYKDPAAVIVGSVLEEHLRQLCEKHGVPLTEVIKGKDSPIKSDRLNSELCKAGAYNKLELKNITAWLDLRNKAAHGKYDEYDNSQVEGLLRDVQSFMTRNPV